MTTAWFDELGEVEIFWTLVSLLAMEPAEQLRWLGDVPPRRDPIGVNSQFNPLLSLQAALDDFYNFAWDSLDPNTQALEHLKVRLDALAAEDLDLVEQGLAGRFSREELQHGECWRELRELAHRTLEVAGHVPRQIREPITFEGLIEFQR
jgi:hypothetical protein